MSALKYMLVGIIGVWALILVIVCLLAGFQSHPGIAFAVSVTLLGAWFGWVVSE